jgi:hypothetical protein
MLITDTVIILPIHFTAGIRPGIHTTPGTTCTTREIAIHQLLPILDLQYIQGQEHLT